MLNRGFFFAAIILLSTLTSGCLLSRNTTTERTAIEQDLIAEAVERTLDNYLLDQTTEGKSFFINDETVDKVDKLYLLNALRFRLLQAGYTQADKAEDAQLIVVPRAASVGIDDSSILIGLPAFKVGFFGTTEIPEAALFKKETQKGRARMGVHAYDRETGNLEFDLPVEGAETYYLRYKLLLIFGWRSTDLEHPF